VASLLRLAAALCLPVCNLSPHRSPDRHRFLNMLDSTNGKALCSHLEKFPQATRRNIIEELSLDELRAVVKRMMRDEPALRSNTRLQSGTSTPP
jgi:hypothetical protein